MSTAPDNNNSFMDPKTLLAVGICATLFFGWQAFMAHKYPDYYKPKGQVAETGTTGASGTAVTSPPTAVTGAAPTSATLPTAAPTVEVPETVHSFENESVRFEISSKGMGLQKIALRNYKDQHAKEVTLGGNNGTRLFEIGIVGREQPLDFSIQSMGESSFLGQARVDQMVVTHQMNIDRVTSRIDSLIKIENAPADFKGLTVKQTEPHRKGQAGSVFMPSLDVQEFLVETDGSVERLHPTDDEILVQEFKTSSLWGIGSQYFVTVISDRSAILPSVKIEAKPGADLQSLATYAPVTISPLMELKWTSYAGGKSSTALAQVDPELVKVVNFGFFSSIGKVLLKVLIWAHGIVGNWGWAIVILTVLVRFIVLPFNVFSYKSMKKMQVIQPQLQEIRARYKDDPTALNRETMALMRDQKVNPLGGCLPLLLQMPVFFALYQVLGQSIELYQAPFIFWIQDLSQKDPYFVLPVLMGVTMFVQQKITPTTMDPTQAKIMLWMPLVFSVFTFGLPSGLTLYIFISTLFGVIQQQLFMIDRSGGVNAANATITVKKK